MTSDPTTPRLRAQDTCAAGKRDLVAYDGRDPVGFIRKFSDSAFAAYDGGGRYLGRFPTQQAALRAIPARRRQP
jgi:hypothetical protein